MPYHVIVMLPDGRVACADWEEPVTKAMHSVNRALSSGRPGSPEDYAAIGAWLDSHEEESAKCRAGIARDGPFCGHL